VPIAPPGHNSGYISDVFIVLCLGWTDHCFVFFPDLQRLALSEINTSRYVEEFHQIAKLGDGEFGSVYKCVNRLDGCTYAIKKSKMPVAGSIYE